MDKGGGKFYQFKRRPTVRPRRVQRRAVEHDLIVDSEHLGPRRSRLSTLTASRFLIRALQFVFAFAILVGGGFFVWQARGLSGELTGQVLAAKDKLSDASEAILTSEFILAKNSFKEALDLFDDIESEFFAFGQFALLGSNLPLGDSSLLAAQSIVRAGRELSTAGVAISEVMLPFVNQIDDFVAPGSHVTLAEFAKNFGDSLIQADDKLAGALASVDSAHRRLGYVQPESLPVDFRDEFITLRAQLGAYKHLLADGVAITKSLPQILGLGGESRIMLLFQNTNELRGSTGFPGSYGVLNLEDAWFTGITVGDIHAVDGQLIGKRIPPPKPLRVLTDYLGVRDAGYTADFAEASVLMQNLYEEAGGTSVDGVIAITPRFMETVLLFVGNVEMPRYGVTLTPENFVDELQHQIEIVEQGGESPKQILFDLTPIIIERIINLDEAERLNLFTEIMDMLRSKDITLYFNDQNVQQAVTALNFGGELDKRWAGDYLAVLATDLGGNKSGGSLKNALDYDVTVQSSGQLTGTVTITKEHTGTYIFPDGVALEYLRVYTPQGSQLLKITGQDEDRGVDTFEEYGKTVFGFWLSLEPGESKAVKLNYSLPDSLSVQSSFTGEEYRLKIQKQPGSDTETRVRLYPSSAQRVKSYYAPLKLLPTGHLEYSAETLKTDLIFKAKIAQK